MDRKFSVVELPATTVTLLILMIWSNQKTARFRIIVGLAVYVVITALVPTVRFFICCHCSKLVNPCC